MSNNDTYNSTDYYLMLSLKWRDLRERYARLANSVKDYAELDFIQARINFCENKRVFCLELAASESSAKRFLTKDYSSDIIDSQ